MASSQIIVTTSDNRQTDYPAGGQVNFDRDNLLITLQHANGISGWHWDHLACMQQFSPAPAPEPANPSAKICEIALIFPNGAEKRLTVTQFQSAELKMANSILIIKGTRDTALINTDFLKWYQTGAEVLS